jgi:hypothetical protein
VSKGFDPEENDLIDIFDGVGERDIGALSFAAQWLQRAEFINQEGTFGKLLLTLQSAEILGAQKEFTKEIRSRIIDDQKLAGLITGISDYGSKGANQGNNVV